VREDSFLREVGYRVRSGLCRVHGEEVIFVERTLPPEERVQVLLEGLAGRDVEALYLSPVLRRLLEARRSAAAERRAMPVRARMRQFEQALRERSLKSTSQRDDIARVFFAAESHLSIRGALPRGEEGESRVGYATVYRTLKLLKEVGLAAERHFDDGQARLRGDRERETRITTTSSARRCGKIVEFASHELERLQERIGRFLGFTVGRHRMELYGICGRLPRGSGARAPARAGRAPALRPREFRLDIARAGQLCEIEMRFQLAAALVLAGSLGTARAADEVTVPPRVHDAGFEPVEITTRAAPRCGSR